MAQARPHTVIESLREYIQNNVEDPNPNRKTDTPWVKKKPTEYDIPKYPKVKIIPPENSTHTGFSLGSDCRKVEKPIQINIFHEVGSSFKMDIDADGENEDVDNVIDFVTQEVIDSVNENQDRWKNLGDNIINFVTTSDGRVPEPGSTQKYVVEATLKMTR